MVDRYDWDEDMVGTENGKYVLYTDYAAVERSLEELRAAVRTGIVPYPAVTSHRKCEKCGKEMRKHGYLEATNEAICI